ncbi:hypothetical protein ma422 [Moumouvirus australiensis]|uniref:Uncharacterized protein n=1 Tax=Moumouvirus australiensis TaxID=2109587 RepID=A0A2P1ELS1_9VIRU|nr:hypothetical protein QKC55_gp483 [Moumouvirus australiensis]AVL94808.1 hypothetical protein ma422 [Moumouvirus australiensis]
MENFCAKNVLPFILSSETNNLLNMFMPRETSRNTVKTNQKSNYIRCLEDHLKYQNKKYSFVYRGYTFNIFCPIRFNWIAEVKIPFNHVDYRVFENQLNQVYTVHNGIQRNYGSDSLIITTDSPQDYCLLRESIHGTNESRTIYRDFDFVKKEAMFLIDQMCERQNLYLAGKRRTQYARNVRPTTPKNIPALNIVDIISQFQGSNSNYTDILNKITNLGPGQSVFFDIQLDGDSSNSTEEQFYQNNSQSNNKNQQPKETVSRCCEEDCDFCNDPYTCGFDKVEEQNDLSDTNTDYLYNYFINEDKLKQNSNKKPENNYTENNDFSKYMDIFTNYFMESLKTPKKETEKKSDFQTSTNLIDDLLNMINQPKSTANNTEHKKPSEEVKSESNKKDSTVITKDGVTISDYDENDEDYNQYEFIPDTCSPINCSVYNSESKTDDEEQAMLSNNSEDNYSIETESTDSEMPSLEDAESSAESSQDCDNFSYVDDHWSCVSQQEFQDANVNSE